MFIDWIALNCFDSMIPSSDKSTKEARNSSFSHPMMEKSLFTPVFPGYAVAIPPASEHSLGNSARRGLQASEKPELSSKLSKTRRKVSSRLYLIWSFQCSVSSSSICWSSKTFWSWRQNLTMMSTNARGLILRTHLEDIGEDRTKADWIRHVQNQYSEFLAKDPLPACRRNQREHFDQRRTALETPRTRRSLDLE